MTTIAGEVRRKLRNKPIPATVVDVAGTRCTVDLSTGGRRLHGIEWIGDAPTVGDTVLVDYKVGARPLVISTIGTTPLRLKSSPSPAIKGVKAPGAQIEPDNNDSKFSYHNGLQSLQGGQKGTVDRPSEYYHLTADEYENLPWEGPWDDTPLTESGDGNPGDSDAWARGNHNHAEPRGSSRSWAWSGSITPAALTADVNDYNPAGLADAVMIRQDLDNDWNITGLAGGTAGRVIILHNINATYYINLISESASSSAANRFALIDTPIPIPPNGVSILQYDGTTQRWRAVGGAGGGGADAISIRGTTVDPLISPSDADYLRYSLGDDEWQAAPLDPATQVIETGGPTTLDLASIGDGKYLKRSGTTIVGDNPVGAGDVTGPASSVAGNIPVFSDTTGKDLEDSGDSVASIVNYGSDLYLWSNFI